MQKFKEGNRVRVRSWDDMEREFGLKNIPFLESLNIPYEPYISTPLGFLDNMKHLCGETGVVDMVEGISIYTPDGSETKEQRLRITWDNPSICADYELDNGMFELAE